MGQERRQHPTAPRAGGQRYLGVNEIAARFDVSSKTVWKWITTGLLPGSRFGRIWRVSEADLARFEADARFSPPDLPGAPSSAP